MNAPLASAERAQMWRAVNAPRRAPLSKKPEPDAADMLAVQQCAALIQEASKLLLSAAKIAKSSPFTVEHARKFEVARGHLGAAWAGITQQDAVYFALRREGAA